MGGMSINGDRHHGVALSLVLPFLLLHHLCPLCPCWWEPWASRGHNGAGGCGSARSGVQEAPGLRQLQPSMN